MTKTSTDITDYEVVKVKRGRNAGKKVWRPWINGALQTTGGPGRWVGPWGNKHDAEEYMSGHRIVITVVTKVEGI